MQAYPVSAVHMSPVSKKRLEISPRSPLEDICPVVKKPRTPPADLVTAARTLDPLMVEEERLRLQEKEDVCEVDALMAHGEYLRQLEKEDALLVDPRMAEQEALRRLEKESACVVDCVMAEQERLRVLEKEDSLEL